MPATVHCHPRDISGAFTTLETLQLSGMCISQSTTWTQPQGVVPWHSAGSKVCCDHLPPKQRFISAARETWCWKHCAGCGRRKCRAAGRYSHSSRDLAVQHTSLLRPPPANRSLPPPFKLSDNFQCSQEKMLEPSQNKSSHSMSSYKISSKGQPSS